MSQQTAFFPLVGGLDLVTPAIAVKPGRAVAALNYEPVEAGYQRAAGYERFDGHPKPSEAAINYMPVVGASAIAAGQTVTGAASGATGVVLADVALGADHIGLTAIMGTFDPSEAVKIGVATVATTAGDVVVGFAPDAEQRAAWVASAASLARAQISAVPGSGSVLGAWKYAGSVYAVRNNDAGTAAVMWKSSPAGWVQVLQSHTLLFTSGGAYEAAEGDVITGATSGATATVRRVVLQSGGFPAGTAEGYLVISPISGTFVAENLNIGVNLNVATIAEAPIQNAFPPGGRYEFLTHNFYGASNLTRVYGVNGVGYAFEFDGTTIVPIRTGMVIDAPTRIAVHRQHLFLAFPGGSLQFSEVGEPLRFSAVLGAGEIALGHEITDLIPNNTEVLTILTENSIASLYGNDADDFVLQTLTDGAGAMPWTADKLGNPIYMDNRGVRSITSSQAFGNFNVGTLTSDIQPYIRNRRAAGAVPVAACVLRSKNQYRLFFSNGEGIYIFTGRKQPESMPFNLGKVVTCVFSIEGDDRNEEAFFGSTDGMVYQLDKGTSFDGAPIEYFAKLAFNHLGAPQVLKRWYKAVIECQSAPTATIRVSSDFNYGDPDFLTTPGENMTINGGGLGLWDSDLWDTFYWDGLIAGQAEVYFDGVGKSLSLLIAGAGSDEQPHLLQGITLYYTPRGLQR